VKPASLTASDFQKALGTRPVSRTAHFALHLLWREENVCAPDAQPELSTPVPDAGAAPVEDCRDRLGLVLPKKQARRSVTRSLIRHQARESVRRHGAQAGMRRHPTRKVDAWVVRLTRGFERSEFPSAASDALRVAVRAELDELWARVARVQA